jgi:hypothetical protein
MSDTMTQLDGLIAELELEVVAEGGGDKDDQASSLCSIGCSSTC